MRRLRHFAHSYRGVPYYYHLWQRNVRYHLYCDGQQRAAEVRGYASLTAHFEKRKAEAEREIQYAMQMLDIVYPHWSHHIWPELVG